MTTIDPTGPLQLTVNPQKSSFYESTSPAQSGKFKPTETVNNDFFGTLSDVIDTLNPLQHIPGVSTVYQAMTGDTQSTGAKIAGGALYGGPIGFLASIFDSIVQSATGNDIGGNIMAAISGTSTSNAQLAANEVTDKTSALSPAASGPANAAYLKTAGLL